MRIESIMTREVIWLNPTDFLIDAYELMREFQVRHLPVVVDNIPVGLVSERDLLLEAQITESQLTFPDTEVESIMSNDIVTCSSASQVADVAATMIECKIGSMVVINEHGELAGIITSSDLLDLLRQKDEVKGRRVLPLDVGVRNPDRDAERVATARR